MGEYTVSRHTMDPDALQYLMIILVSTYQACSGFGFHHYRILQTEGQLPRQGSRSDREINDRFSLWKKYQYWGRRKRTDMPSNTGDLFRTSKRFFLYSPLINGYNLFSPSKTSNNAKRDRPSTNMPFPQIRPPHIGSSLHSESALPLSSIGIVRPQHYLNDLPSSGSMNEEEQISKGITGVSETSENKNRATLPLHLPLFLSKNSARHLLANGHEPISDYRNDAIPSPVQHENVNSVSFINSKLADSEMQQGNAKLTQADILDFIDKVKPTYPNTGGLELPIAKGKETRRNLDFLERPSINPLNHFVTRDASPLVIPEIPKHIPSSIFHIPYYPEKSQSESKRHRGYPTESSSFDDLYLAGAQESFLPREQIKHEQRHRTFSKDFTLSDTGGFPKDFSDFPDKVSSEEDLLQNHAFDHSKNDMLDIPEEDANVEGIIVNENIGSGSYDPALHLGKFPVLQSDAPENIPTMLTTKADRSKVYLDILNNPNWDGKLDGWSAPKIDISDGNIKSERLKEKFDILNDPNWDGKFDGWTAPKIDISDDNIKSERSKENFDIVNDPNWDGRFGGWTAPKVDVSDGNIKPGFYQFHGPGSFVSDEVIVCRRTCINEVVI